MRRFCRFADLRGIILRRQDVRCERNQLADLRATALVPMVANLKAKSLRDNGGRPERTTQQDEGGWQDQPVNGLRLPCLHRLINLIHNIRVLGVSDTRGFRLLTRRTVQLFQLIQPANQRAPLKETFRQLPACPASRRFVNIAVTGMIQCAH